MSQLIFPATQNNPLINSPDVHLFAHEVLNELRNKRVTFKGCQPDYVEIFLTGKVKVWFHGHRDGRAWRGGVGFNCVRPEDRVYMTDPAIVAEMCKKHIELMNAG